MVAPVAMAPVVLMIGGRRSVWSIGCASFLVCFATVGVLSTLISMSLSLSPIVVVLSSPSDLPCPLLSSSRVLVIGFPFVPLFARSVVVVCAGVCPTIILFASLVGFRLSSSLAFIFILLCSDPLAFVSLSNSLLFLSFGVVPGPHLIRFCPIVPPCQACWPS